MEVSITGGFPKWMVSFRENPWRILGYPPWKTPAMSQSPEVGPGSMRKTHDDRHVVQGCPELNPGDLFYDKNSNYSGFQTFGFHHQTLGDSIG